MNSLAVLSAFIFVSTAPAIAQGTCGWDEAAAPDHLPKFVETVIAQLPGSWSDADKTVANLGKWYHECDVTAGHQAMFDLQRAAQRNKNDMAVVALYGLALVHGPEVQVEGATGVSNRAVYHLSNSERDGARLLARASTDPRFADAAIDLAQLAIGTRHEATVNIARDALKNLTSKQPLAEMLRYEAELAVIAKDYAYAITQGERAARAGDRGALHAVGIARVFTSTDSTSAADYLAGMSDPSAIDLYYDDLSYLLEPEDTLAWSRLKQSERGDWIRNQWRWRASTSSLSIAERLKIHFTRLLFAWDNYPRTAFRVGPMNNAIVFDPHLRHMSVDDRGLIYIRHGPPAEIIRMSSSGLDNTRIAWGYNGLADGRAVFEFTKMDCPRPVRDPVTGTPVRDASTTKGYNPAANPAPGQRGRRTLASGGSAAVQSATPATTARCSSSGDYYLASPLPCDSHGSATDQATYYDYGAAIAKYDPALAQLMSHCFNVIETNNPSELFYIDMRYDMARRKSVDQGATALTTETAGPALTSPIATVLHTYAMRDGGATQLYAFAALNGADIHPATGTSDYGLRLMLSVENDANLTTENVDTALTFKTASPMTVGQFARTRVSTLTTPVDNATLRFTVRNENDPSQGQIITTKRDIPDLNGPGLAMSDLVIADTRDGTWHRGGVSLSPIPGHYVNQGSTFRLYYELYGATAGDSLSVQITIAPGADESVLSKIKELISRKGAFQVGFAERAIVDNTGVSRVSREIGADLEPGRYLVTVSVRDPKNSASASSRTEIVVVK